MSSMPNGLRILFACLALASVGFGAFLARDLVARARRGERVAPRPLEVAIGALTDFLDTLGIGSFAITTALYRALRVVPEDKLPGTMNAGHALPTFVQAFVYVAILDVDRTTLALLVSAAVIGAFASAGRVARWPRERVMRGLGASLLLAAALLAASALGVGPTGGSALGLSGSKLALATVACGAFGALMTIGVGAYAPILVTVSVLGMDPRAAFPIMMSACAFLMPAASVRFVRAGAYAPGATLGLLVGGVPAVLVAAFVVRSLPLDVVKGLVVVVVLATAITLLRDARRVSASS